MSIDRHKVIDNAQKYAAKSQWDKAVAEYMKVLKEDPKDVRILQKIAELQIKKGSKDDAIATYSRVAKIYDDEGFFLKSIAVFKQILSIDPNLTELYSKLADLYVKLGLIPDALANLDALATRYARLGNDPMLLSVYKQMSAIDETNVACHIKLAELYSKLGRNDEAAESFENGAALLKGSGRLDDWAKVAERLLFHRPANEELAKELARHYLDRKDARNALPKLQVCFKNNPKDVDTLEMLAMAFRDLGQLPKTISVLKEVARIHNDQGRPEQRIEVLKKVLEYAPGDVEAREAVHGPAKGKDPARTSGPVGAPPPAGNSGRGPRPPGASPSGQFAAQSMARSQAGSLPGARQSAVTVEPEEVDLVDDDDTGAGRRSMLARMQAARASGGAAPAAGLPVPPPAANLPVPPPAGRAAASRGAAPAAAPAPPPAPAAKAEAPGPKLPAPPPPAPAAARARKPTPPPFEAEPRAAQAPPPPAPVAVPVPPPAPAAARAREPAPARPAPAPAPVVQEPVVQEPVRESTPVIDEGAIGLQPLDPPTEEAAAEAAKMVGEADVFLRYNLRPKAVAHLERAAEIDPTSIDAHVRLRDLYAEDGDAATTVRHSLVLAQIVGPNDPATALAEVEHALQILPEDPDAIALYHQLSAIVHGTSLPSPEPPPAAQPAYEEPAPQAVNEATGPAQLPARDVEEALEEVEFFVSQGLYDDALETLRQLYEQHPDNQLVIDRWHEVDALAQAAAQPAEDNSFALAEKLAEEVSAHAPSGASFSAGQEMLDVDSVFAQFKKGVEKAVSPDDVDTHYDLGIAYREMGLVDDAIREFGIASAGPKKACLCFTMIGLCYMEKGEVALAIENFGHALSSPNRQPREEAGLYYELGNAYETVQQYGDALAFFERVFEYDPSFRDVAERVQRLRAYFNDGGGEGGGEGGEPPDDVDMAFAGIVGKG